jgi:hypothetical protein
MPARLFAFLTVFTLVIVPTPARSADEKKAGTPTVVIRLDSINNLIEDVKYIANLSGQKDKADEGLGFIKSIVDEKGIDKAIDFNRPLAIYGSINTDNPMESTGALLVPVADEKHFLDLLEQNQLTAEKGEDAVYTVNPQFSPVPFYFRFANKYAYIAAQNKSSVEKSNLLDPAKVFSSGKGLTFSAEFRLDQIPAEFRDMGVTLFETKVEEEKTKKIPGETEAQTTIRHKTIDEVTKQAATLIKEGGEIALSYNIDRKAGELKGEASFSGKAGSKLAAGIADLSKAKSLFAGLGASDSAMKLLAHLSLPEDLRKGLEPIVDDGIKEAVKHQTDATKRERREKILKALEPTIKAGELDALFNMSGPDKNQHYAFFMGIKIREGKQVEAELRDLVRLVPERDRHKIKLDAEKAGGVSIHRVDIQEIYDEKLRSILGDSPIYLAVRQDALLVGVGTEGLSLIKEAIKAEPKAAPQMELAISVAHLAPLIGLAERLHEKNPTDEIRKASEEAFGKADKKNDKIRITVEGGKSFRGTFTMSAPVIKFLGQLLSTEPPHPLFEERGKAEKKKKEADKDK